MKKNHTRGKAIGGFFLSLFLTCAFLLATAWFSHKVEQPLGGILTALTALAYFGGFYRIRRRMQKRAATGTSKEKTGVMELSPDELPDGPEESELGVVRIYAFTPNRVYRLSRDEGQYRFIYTGNEVMGAVSEKPEAKKDILLRWSDIADWKLSPRADANVHLPNFGVVTVRTKEHKKLRFVVLDEIGEREILSFFSAIHGKRIEGKHEDRRRALREKDAEYGAWLRENQKPETLKKLRSVRAVLSVGGVLAAAGALYIASPYDLWILLCLAVFLAAVVLAAAFPVYFSLLTDAKTEKSAYGADVLCLILPLVVPLSALILRMAMDFNILSWKALFVADGVFALALTGLLSLTVPEFRRSVLESITCFLVLAAFSFGAVGEVNYLLDFREPDYYVSSVIEKKIFSSSDRPDQYGVTVLMEDGELLELSVSQTFYEEVQRGGGVTVCVCKGALDIPYTIVS